MAMAVDRYLDQLEAGDGPDRRNGHYPRHLRPRSATSNCGCRGPGVTAQPGFCALCPAEAEVRVILAGFVLGLSTRKVGETLLAMSGRELSATTVSRVAKTLDSAVAAFHRRRLKNQYKALMLDGVVLARKTGAGALRRPVLVALGLRPRRQEGDHRLPLGGERKRRRMGALSHRSVPAAASPAKASTWSASMEATAYNRLARRPAWPSGPALHKRTRSRTSSTRSKRSINRPSRAPSTRS